MRSARRASIALCAAMLSSWSVAPRLRAQEPSAGTPVSPAPAVVAPDSLAPFERPNGALLRPVSSTFQLTLTRAGTSTPLGVRTVQVSEAQVGGVPGWLIAESRTGTAVPTSDSLWVSRADLSPERWVASIDRTQLGASFTRDSVFGAMQSYRGRSSFSAAIPPGTLVTAAMIEQVIALLPLRLGYHAGASLLLLEMGAPRTLPAEIAVEREDRSRIGMRDLDCWVVVVRAGVLEERLWVTKGVQRVVRTEQAVSAGVMTAVITE